jgi:hypothetical protein
MKRVGAIKYVLLLLFPVFACLPTQGQDKVVDSLLLVLQQTHADTNRVKVLNELSYYYFSSDTGKAENYRKQGERLATQLHYSNGLAYSRYLIGRKYHADNNFILPTTRWACTISGWKMTIMPGMHLNTR